MPERRRTRTAGGQVKAKRPTTQTTLKDLFQKTVAGIVSSGKKQEIQQAHTEPIASPLEVARPAHPAQLPQPPQPIQLYPIFTKVLPTRETSRDTDTFINVDDTEVIDITDMSSDAESPTEPPLSPTRRLSPRSEFSRAASHSSPVTHLDVSDTSLTHASEQGHDLRRKFGKESNRRALRLGSIVPFPSSCSQHVRGVQHLYTSNQAPLKHGSFPGSTSSHQGTLNFLTRRQVDARPSLLSDRINRSLSSEQREEYLQSLRRDCTEAHPVFAQISVQQGMAHLRSVEMWTRRFRPRRADEVLGNERHALYLRDWLRALELRSVGRQPEESMSEGATAREGKAKNTLKWVEPRGVKRARVVRAVAKKRGNKKRRVDSEVDLNDFVVFSDADEEPLGDLPEDSEDELAFCQRTLTRLHRRDATDIQDARPATSDDLDTEIKHTASQTQGTIQTNFSDNVTNTLLITGPPGCGKTAAVYACAEELGWEIFEVYPGIGRRNGANLGQLVGDVGRNHIVQAVRRRVPNKTTKLEANERTGPRDFLGKKKTGKFAGFVESEEAGTEGEPIGIEDDGSLRELQPLPPEREKDTSEEGANCGKCHAEVDRPIVRQSLVLLEEVDILFREDAGFWPAVVDFIRCCQRPVVMTCNDPGLVPLGDLPLQTVLVFEPCPSTVAATFLQCVSLAEGCLVPHEDLMVLYESVDGIGGLEMADAGRAERVQSPDLRRSITQLQMLCAGARHGSGSENEAEGHVRRSAGAISGASRDTAMRGRVGSEWWRKMNLESELMSHVDAELWRARVGRGEVVTDEAEVGYVVVEERGGGGDDIWEGDELIRHSRGAHEESGTGPSDAAIDPAARVEYQSRMVEALQDVVAPAGGLMRQGSVFVDYIPWVREMVLVDDELERRAMEGRGGSGRCTRNSLRTVHARNVVLGEEERMVLARTRLA